MAEDCSPVKLHVYDLSQGMARQLSASLLGTAIEGIWHTGVVAYGIEYYFGPGIVEGPPGKTPFGRPMRILDLGVTHVPKEVFDEYLQEIGPRFTANTYNLLEHNCNNFSNEAVQFLVGDTIPSYILELPNVVRNSPMGALLVPLIQNLDATMRSGSYSQSPLPIPAATLSAAPTPAAPSLQNLTSGESTAPPAAQPVTASTPKKEVLASASLLAAQRRIEDEIKAEFSALVAWENMQPNEAAVLALKRVKERNQRKNGSSNSGSNGYA